VEFDGVWTKYYEGKDRIHVGSALLYPGDWSYNTGPYGPVCVRKSYNKTLLTGCFYGVNTVNTDFNIETSETFPTPPDGYKLQIQFSGALSTGGGNDARVRLNGLDILRNISWGDEVFRPVVKSRFFDLDEITTAPLKDYGGTYAGAGLCLMFQNFLPSGVGSNWVRIGNLMGHGYFTSINNCCKWKRVS